MLQIYKQNRALYNALMFSSLENNSGAQVDTSASVEGGVKADSKLTAQEQKVLRDFLASRTAEITKETKLGTERLSDLINKDIRTRVEQHIGKDGVKAIQKALGLTADGDYGPATFKKIVAYQRKNDLLVDGIVGKNTYSHIMETSGSPTVITFNENTGETSSSIESTETLTNDVQALQSLIGTTVDGKWGKNSQKALNTYLKKGKNAVKDVQRVIGTTADGVWGKNSRNKLQAFIGVQSVVSKSQSLGENIAVTGRSVDKLTEFIKTTSGKNVDSLYNAIAKGKNFNEQGYHILNLVQRAFGKNEATAAQGRAADIFNIVNKNRSKFNRAYSDLLGNQYKDNAGKDASGELTHQGQTFLRHAKKALPWVAGVYVLDIPLPFMRKMVPSGVPMDKAFAFTKWVKEGMKGEFKPNEKVETGTEALSHLKGLRNILGTATKYAEANANKNNLKQVAGKVKTLISTYIIHRFGPDANIIRESAQNPFENLFDAIGIKGKSKKLIDQIMKDAASGKVNFNDVFQLEGVLWAEDNDGIFGLNDGANAGFIRSFSNRNAYIASASRQGDIIEQYVAAIVKGKGNFNALQTKERQAAGIPDTNAKYRKGRVDPGAYGPDLSQVFKGRDIASVTGEEVYRELTSTRPSQAKNRDSIGWIMRGIRSLEIDMDAKKIPHSVIGNAIKNGKMVPLSQVGKVAVNTSRDGKVVSTDVATLVGRGDTHMFHAPIEYTVDGQKLKYNLYMRPDCSNFVMVPEKWDNKVGVGVNGRLPVVIPWNVLIPGSEAGNVVSSRPGDDLPIPEIPDQPPIF